MSDPAHNPCGPCGACCRSYIVPVCGYDIWLISTGQHLSPETFLVACPQEEPGRDGLYLEAGGQAYGLALDKRGRFAPRQPCVFLLGLADGETRCGVYADRPIVCRAYPMRIWGGVVFQRKESICPPAAWPGDAVRRPAWRTALQRFYMQMDVYAAVVARWNARVAAYPGARFTLYEYFSYILNVYDRLAGLTADLGAEAVAEIEAAWPTVPRPHGDLTRLRGPRAAPPWITYLLHARGIIDSFYPNIPLDPTLVLAPEY